MAISIVYMTAGNTQEAARIAKSLVQRRLVACVNILDGIRSIYEWKGTLQDEREVVMIAKTNKECMPELVSAVKTLHSYECPCIVELAASGGNNEFLEWIDAQVGTPIKKDD
jgi:periplasmic divalent cation tolerance protein